ncbi:MAG: sulfatase-like hydrolase/transferase [Opitutales bacterium]
MAKPNIIFLFSDQHRGDWLSGLGHLFARTPHLDALASAGSHFTQAYCNYPLCGPSRMSVMTGRHPHRNGVYVNEHCLPSDAPTVAHGLAQAGYETILAGRMHFSGPDQRHGFQQRYVGDLNACMGGGPHAMGEGAMRQAANNAKGAASHYGFTESPGLQFDEAVTLACEHILSQPRDAQHPLFLTAGFFLPHHPFFVPEAHYQAALDSMPEDDAPLPPIPREALHPFDALQYDHVVAHGLTSSKRREIRALYAAMITWLDERLGRVIEAAKRLPGETIVLYSSDHGEFACDHDRIGKVSFLEPSLHVPLIAARFREGRPFGPNRQHVTAPVSLLDVLPTCLDVAQAPFPCPIDGASLLPLIEGREQSEDATWRERAVFAELCIRLGQLRFPASRCVRQGSYKLHYHLGMPSRLFNLAEDPHEQNDLTDSPRHAEVKARLEAQILDGWNPEAVEALSESRSVDTGYLREWGRMGLGPRGEVFDPERDPTRPC